MQDHLFADCVYIRHGEGINAIDELLQVAVTTAYEGQSKEFLSHPRYDLTDPAAVKPSWFGKADLFLLTSKGLAFPYDMECEWMANMLEEYMDLAFGGVGFHILPEFGSATGYGICATTGNVGIKQPPEGADLNQHATAIFGVPVYSAVFLFHWKGHLLEVEPGLKNATDAATKAADKIKSDNRNGIVGPLCWNFTIEPSALTRTTG